MGDPRGRADVPGEGKGHGRVCTHPHGLLRLLPAAGEAGKEGMQKKHAMKCMMDMMMNKQMVSTSDGGVVVLFGHKLYKYDKNLNLVKEAEIKMDFEAMKKKMQEMKEKCPMYEKMMQGKEEATEKKD